MRNSLLLVLLFGLLIQSCTKHRSEHTQTVQFHKHQTIICNGITGNNLFPAWAVFPSKEKDIRRLYMTVRLAHPDSLAIAHWDYLDPLTVRRIGGVKAENRELEIGKMLTPYGSSFSKDWAWNWRIDVTDFADILRDSVELIYNHSGYEGGNVGWDLSVHFEVEYGKPVANFLGYQKLYHGAYAYGKKEISVNELLEPQKVGKLSGADFARVRVLHTGHGMDPPTGCSEFCTRWREVRVDGKMIDHRDMWKECGDNNLYPQGGTWIFDRAAWCPGDLQTPALIDFPLTQDTHTVEFEMEPYELPSSAENQYVNAVEQISATLFQYEAPNNQYDVSVEQIRSPNLAPELNRYNPAVAEPIVVIQNLGSETLTSVLIRYGTEGFEQKEFTWEGSLPFYETAVVRIPDVIDFNRGANNFTVELCKPNGKTDQWQGDNTMKVAFNSPKEMPKNLVVTYKTNSMPQENDIEIQNPQGKVVYRKLGDDCEPNFLYRDTLTLAEDVYRMALADSAHNGLEFWFMPYQGYGYLQIEDLNGRVLHRFTSDCGVGEQFDFQVKNSPRIDSNVSQNLLTLYPKRTVNGTQLFIQLEKPSDGKIVVNKDGQPQFDMPFEQVKNEIIDIELDNYPPGRYVVEVFIADELVLKQRIAKMKPRK